MVSCPPVPGVLTVPPANTHSPVSFHSAVSLTAERDEAVMMALVLKTKAVSRMGLHRIDVRRVVALRPGDHGGVDAVEARAGAEHLVLDAGVAALRLAQHRVAVAGRGNA